MTSRRRFVAAATAAFFKPLFARAQANAKPARIGYLSDLPAYLHAPGAPRASLLAEFQEGLREHGYAAGENLSIDYRYAEGKLERLSDLATELVRSKVDVIVPAGTASLRAARSATARIPIVALDLQVDPVAEGFVASLRRPGGNVTGLFLDQPEIAGKWLQLLREAVPAISRTAVLWDSTTPRNQLSAVESAAKALGVTLRTLAVSHSRDLGRVFDSVSDAQALVILSSPMIASQGPSIALLAATRHLPSISAFAELATAGGLMAYGPNLIDLYRRLGAIVGRMLQGVRPEEQPVERPSRFELIVNAQTAKVLGISIPRSTLLRADKVIE